MDEYTTHRRVKFDFEVDFSNGGGLQGQDFRLDIEGEDNSLSKEATDWREGRRLRAFELKQQGWSQQRIAEALGVSKGAVSQWMKRARDGGGAEALKRRPAPGARPRLSEEQRAKVPELLERGAEAHGFRGDVWTCERVARVIRKESLESATILLTSAVCSRL